MDGSGTEDPPGPHSGQPNGGNHGAGSDSPRLGQSSSSHQDDRGGIGATSRNTSKERSTSVGPDLDLVVWDESEESVRDLGAERSGSSTNHLSDGNHPAPSISPRPGPSSRRDGPVAGPSAPEERSGNRRKRTDSGDEARAAKEARRAESSSPEVTWEGTGPFPGAVRWSGPREPESEGEEEQEEGSEVEEMIELPSSDEEE